jgi:general secretion pathway protein K
VIRQKGLALVLVLWVLSLLTIMAGSFALSMRREASITAGIKNNAQAMAVAESGIALAEMMLQNPDPDKRWRADGSIYEIIATDAKVRVRLLAEAGKIDINKADQALLEGLMIYAPVDAEQKLRLVSAILDWRDADDLVHINGAEKKEYQDAGLSYQPANKPFQSIEELQMVLGMNKSVFLQLEPLITVYSGQPHVTMQLAAKEVLQLILGLDTDQVDSYIASRLNSAINNLPVPTSPSSAGQNNAAGQNNVLTLISEAQLDNESRAVISAVIKPSDNTEAQNSISPQALFQVLKWQLATANDLSLFTGAMNELLVKQYAEPELNN